MSDGSGSLINERKLNRKANQGSKQKEIHYPLYSYTQLYLLIGQARLYYSPRPLVKLTMHRAWIKQPAKADHSNLGDFDSEI